MELSSSDEKTMISESSIKLLRSMRVCWLVGKYNDHLLTIRSEVNTWEIIPKEKRKKKRNGYAVNILVIN